MTGIAYYRQLCELFPSFTLWIVKANTERVLFGPGELKFPSSAAVDDAKITWGGDSIFLSVHMENSSVIIADTKQTDQGRALKLYDWLTFAASFCSRGLNDRANAPEYKKLSSLLARYLFNRLAPDDQDYISFLTAKMNVNFSTKRIICLFDDLLQNTTEISRYMIDFLQSPPFYKKDDIICALDDELPILCRSIDTGSQWRRNICETISPLIAGIRSKFQVKVNCGISMPVVDVLDYPDAFFEAKSVLKFMKLWGDGHSIGFLEDYSLPYETLLISEEHLLHFFKMYYDMLERDQTLLKTVGALVRCDMDIKSAAMSLGVHHNTVIFRISELKSLLGFDFIHFDRGRVQLAMIYYSYMLRYNPRKEVKQ